MATEKPWKSFEKQRAAFICKMVCSRRDMLLEILEQNEKA